MLTTPGIARYAPTAKFYFLLTATIGVYLSSYSLKRTNPLRIPSANQYNSHPMLRHFIDIAQFSAPDLQHLLDDCQRAPQPVLDGKIIAHLFFENSTRTRCSFEIAAKKLGATVINLDITTSSLSKGETVLDTVQNLQAMGVNAMVIRHGDNGLVAEVAQVVGDDIAIINAGCGTLQHPSQALLDVLTIAQHKPDFSALKVAIIGDLKHSRVSHSAIQALQVLGVRDIRVIAPSELLPKNVAQLPVTLFHDLKTGLADVDVIITLRLQKERMQTALDVNSFIAQYQLTTTRLAYAKPDAIVMHPGPMNREVEITAEVADGPQSVILQQVANGVLARMAILRYCFRSTL